MPSQYAFPWGVYIGDFAKSDTRIPVCVDSQQGGFCVLFDKNSESIANNFIENIALKLFEILPAEAICVDIFDFSQRKRFDYLFQQAPLYQIARTDHEATKLFNQLEILGFQRHDLFSAGMDLSQYNQQSQYPEQYHLLLINLAHYPEEIAPFKRLFEFLNSAYDAGFYCIFFGRQSLISDFKATQFVLEHFPIITAQNKQFSLSEQVFQYIDQVQGYDFEPIDDNKDQIIQQLQQRLEKEEDTTEQDFLSIPIGTSVDGRTTLHFNLGDKSKAYHAFITGVAGSGKTTLLNNIILGIAKHYTAKEIRLYLMDYKEGVEFQVFKNHPNCEKIFLDNNDTQAAIDLLTEFEQTIQQRGELFKQDPDQAINNINRFNQQYPQQALPRLLLIIDEVHRLFTGSYQQKEQFSQQLKQVVRQGRAFGVHIILSTQTLAGTEIDRELMSQITLRLSYRLTDWRDSEALFGHGNTAAQALKTYQLLYNANSGEPSANQICQTHPPQDIEAILSTIINERQNQPILQPVIIKSNPVTASKSPAPSNTNEPLPPSKHYTSDAERALLDKLIANKQVNPPQGYNISKEEENEK